MGILFRRWIVAPLAQITLWRCFRHLMIIFKHNRCKRVLGYFVGTTNSDLLSEIEPLKHFLDTEVIVWQYWAQGYESSMPNLVRICLKSVEKNLQGLTLIRVSDDNLNEYINIPKWLEDKKQHMSKAHFADLLRCVLLSKYGGLWLDAATFLSGTIPSYIMSSDFFLYQRDNAEKHKEYWEKTFAYYWSWSPYFYVKSLIGIMYAKKGNKSITDLASMLLCYWKNNDTAHDYFFFQIMIELYFKKYPESRPPIFSDTVPHLLRQYINGMPTPEYSLDDIFQRTTIHSLNYKNGEAFENLLELFPEYRDFVIF